MVLLTRDIVYICSIVFCSPEIFMSLQLQAAVSFLPYNSTHGCVAY